MKYKLENDGFAHHMILGVIVLVVAIVGVFTFVLRSEHNKSKNYSLSTSSTASDSQTKLNSNNISSAQSASSVNGSSSSSASTSTTAKKSTPTTSKSNSSSPTQTTGNSPAPQTPLSVLISIITDLDNGTGSANVTASNVTIPGPISDAQGRPIVFTANGQTYFAYTQESPPNFSTSASQTAGTMAIVNATVSNPSLTPAHISKTNQLVDADSLAVGYSTGGN